MITVVQWEPGDYVKATRKENDPLTIIGEVVKAYTANGNAWLKIRKDDGHTVDVAEHLRDIVQFPRPPVSERTVILTLKIPESDAVKLARRDAGSDGAQARALTAIRSAADEWLQS
jgi:hypothetical protein